MFYSKAKSRLNDARRNKQLCVIPIVCKLEKTNDITFFKTESYLYALNFVRCKDDFPSAYAVRFVSSVGCPATVVNLIRNNTFSLFSRACASVILCARFFTYMHKSN